MSKINTLWFLGCIALIVMGLVMANPGLYTKFVRYNNKVKGVKTAISKETLYTGKWMGWGLITVGIVGMFFIMAETYNL